MQTVYRYGLGCDNNKPVKVSMPDDAIVLHIDYHPGSGEFCVWVIVNTPGIHDFRTFYVSGTGHDLASGLKGDEEMRHINSFCVNARTPGRAQGWFHAFEVIPAVSDVG